MILGFVNIWVFVFISLKYSRYEVAIVCVRRSYILITKLILECACELGPLTFPLILLTRQMS